MTYAPGQLHSVRWHGDGSFNVAKILVVDERGLHVRVYAESFAVRPQAVPAALEVGSPYDGEAFGVGHVPVTVAEFEGWQPTLLATEPVAEDELDGYRHWKADAATDDYLGEEQPSLITRLSGRLKRR